MKTITERIEKIEQECSGVWGQCGVTDWERQRLAEWKNKPALSPKQESVLAEIEERVFGEEDA